MKIYLEVPDNWIDVESPIIWASTVIRDEARRQLKEALVEQCISKMGEVPVMIIPEDELRAAVKERIVERMVDQAMV